MNVTIWISIFLIGMNNLVFTFIIETREDSILELADCISQATHLMGELKTAVEFDEDHQDIASEILKKLEVPVILNAKETRKATGIERRISIDWMLILKGIEPDKILKNTLWNGRTRFLFILQDLKKIEKYFKLFWKMNVINVFAMVADQEQVLVYSFLPYLKQNCKMVELVTVDTCHKGKLLNGGFAFKDPVRIKNLNGCLINITVNDAKPSVIFKPDGNRRSSFSAKGFEGNLITEIAKIYNFKTNYKLSEDNIGWGWVRPSPHGTVGDVYLGVSEMGIGMLGPLIDRFENLDFSVSYNVDECVTFAVPQGYGTKKFTWITIFIMEFTLTTWCLITFSFILISLNMWVINKYLKVNWFGSKTEMVMLVFSSYLGSPIKTPNYKSAKTSVIFWFFFSFITTIAYKASMGSRLAVPPRDANIYTFKELLHTDLELTGYKNMYQLMVHNNDWTFRNLRKRYHFKNYSVEYAIDHIANGEKMAHLRHKTTFNYYSDVNPKARGRIHLLTECMILFHPLVMIRQYSPFTNKVNRVVSRLEESGIMVKWRSEHEKKIPLLKKPFFKLSVDQMFGILCFLCLGYVIALFSFLCETAHFRSSKFFNFTFFITSHL